MVSELLRRIKRMEKFITGLEKEIKDTTNNIENGIERGKDLTNTLRAQLTDDNQSKTKPKPEG